MVSKWMFLLLVHRIGPDFACFSHPSLFRTLIFFSKHNKNLEGNSVRIHRDDNSGHPNSVSLVSLFAFGECCVPVLSLLGLILSRWTEIHSPGLIKPILIKKTSAFRIFFRQHKIWQYDIKDKRVRLPTTLYVERCGKCWSCRHCGVYRETQGCEFAGWLHCEDCCNTRKNRNRMNLSLVLLVSFQNK